MSVAGLWQELRRRKVVRVVVAYGAVALVLIEAANNILPALGVTDSVNRLVVLATLAGLPIAVLLAWKFDVVPDSGEPESNTSARVGELSATGTRTPTSTTSEPLPHERVAVLPFKDMSEQQTDEYFADGTTEDIIAQLAQMPAFNVVSRTSVMAFRGTQLSIPSIGQQLGAGSIVEGSVRRSGDRVRVVAQLVDANSDATVWAETYNRDLQDVLAVQSDIAASVAEGLHTSLGKEDVARLRAPRQADSAAHDLYLRARHLWNQRSVSGLTESQALLERAIARDPEFALAHAGLASTLATAGLYGLEQPDQLMLPALRAAERALEIEPDHVEALNARGLIECVWSWEWAVGEATFKRAAEVSPSDVVARQWYALNCLAPQGRLEEAGEALAVARSLDPLSPVVRASDGFLRYLARDVDGAEATLGPLVQEADAPPVAHLFMGFVQQLAGRGEDANRHFQAAESAGGRTEEALAALATNRALAGDIGRAESLLQDMVALSKTRFVSPGRLAQVAAAVGDWPVAKGYWDESLRVRASDLIWLGVSPIYDFARGRAELEDVVRAVGAA
ncbi:MAG: hypothetical protein ACR2QM_20450 [Longimicrobiales bacterium]